ncbi:MAG: xylulose kinase [Candidatus Omnitrophica bacterium]|nr:xylulose kinase [Candidatus Omnitrophota bacterium]MCF7876968.1 xylulose kinase [Candidatus Omnitrophota bacterium]MCF7878683.1 xylulose kinase [Candidatus Omnitrophota bacterium]MCF7893047.1 xylulose kinase [Candidatus Omnitrophota bacterium]
MAQFFAAVDCGTSVIKSAIFREDGRLKSVVDKPCPPEIKSRHRIEQCPQLLVDKIFSALKEAVKKAKVKPASIGSLSVSTQRATIIPVGKDKKPLGNFISWQDLRGGKVLGGFREKFPDKKYYKITGIPSNPIFSLAKILWIKKKASQIYKKTDKFLLLHSYLLKELGCKNYLEDYSNASLTGLLDIKKLSWSEKILKAAGLDKKKLAELTSSGKVVGFLSKKAAKKTSLKEGMPLVSGGGDQQCAALGAGAVKPGILEITLGTAGVPLLYSPQPVFDPKMRVMCCAHLMEGRWGIEGFQGCSGSSIQWLDGITGGRGFDKAALTKAKESGPGARGVLFYPYLTGATCPNWDPEAKGMFFGLTLDSTRPDLLRAVMEGISFETKEILKLYSWLGVKVKEIRLSGGGSRNDLWSQIQADIYQKKIFTLLNHQAALAGAAALAAFGAGLGKSLEKTALRFSKVDKIFYPDKKKKTAYNKIYKKYKNIHKSLSKGNIFRK